MKTLLRIVLALFFLLVLFVGVALFAITRPGLQKKLIEAQLPAGSSLGYVRVMPSSIQLRDVDVRAEDGSRLQIARLESAFSWRAAFFDQTIQLRGLAAEGLLIELPEATHVSAPSTPPSGSAEPRAVELLPLKAEPPAPAAASEGISLDGLYALGELEWLVDIDSIQIEGALVDAFRNRYSFDVASSAIAPGLESELEGALRLESSQAMPGGLQTFSSTLHLIFFQNLEGGFESLDIKVGVSGRDRSGQNLLSVSQDLRLRIDGAGRSASLAFTANATLPEPGVFLPELANLRGLELQGTIAAAASGPVLKVEQADVAMSGGGQVVAAVKLEQAIIVGGQQQFTGRLLAADLIDWPLAWLSPWLGGALELSGAPISAQLEISGDAAGGLTVETGQPLNWGPLTVYQEGQPLLEGVTLRGRPRVHMDADSNVAFEFDGFELVDRFGPFIQGDLNGRKATVAPGRGLFGGLTGTATLEIGLADLLKQPILQGHVGVLAGQIALQLTIDGEADYPAQARGAVTGLRSRAEPGTVQDLRFAAQLKETQGGAYALGANLQIGPERRPSTHLQIAGQVNPTREPMPFQLDVTAPSFAQRDMDRLLAFRESPVEADRPVAVERAPIVGRTSPVAPAEPLPISPPPWAALDGEVGLQVEQFTLNSGMVIEGLAVQARVSERLLEVRELTARQGDGRLGGTAQVDYDPARVAEPYRIVSKLEFRNVDPVIFSKKRSGSFPVRGLFDGDFELGGAGLSLDDALEHSSASVSVRGREGVLTAFEIDDRSQLGLLGAGLLGQQLNRPGITAMAEAIPYFKDMRFERFALELSRGKDKIVRVPEIAFLGANLRIQGGGLIAASRLNEVLEQPLQLTLDFGAKGRLVNHLEVLGLLGPAVSEDGFRNWNQSIAIAGTLSEPDTSSLKNMLSEAARRAISGRSGSAEVRSGQTATEGSTTPEAPRETRRDRRRDDIEMGLDLLNSLLGN